MQSGAVRGYVGALTGIITDIQKELGGKARVVATGGMGRMMAEYCDLIDDVDPNLTLEGRVSSTRTTVRRLKTASWI